MLKQTLLTSLLLGLFSLNATAQVPVLDWGRSTGGTNSDFASSTTTDAMGNIYTTGGFRETVDFDPGPGTMNITSAGFSDIYIQKLDASGNFIWAKAIQGGAFLSGSSIATDATGNVYITGSVRNTVDFDPGPGIFNITATAGIANVFILKLDNNGNFVWAKPFIGDSGETINSIALDATGNVYTIGHYVGTTDFDPGAATVNLTAEGINDVFISKLDINGNFVWVKSVGGTTRDFGQAITIDASGNVLTTGHFTGTVDFDPGAGTTSLTSEGAGDVFILKLAANGNFVWAKTLGGDEEDDIGYSLVTDATGNVYVAGFFQKTVDFDPGPGTTELSSTFFGADAFILKLNSLGNFVWVKKMGGFGREEARGIAIDASANIYTIGFFSQTADFDPGPGTNNLTYVGFTRDIFIQKLDTDGDFVWARAIGGSSNQAASSISVDASNSIHIAGSFEATVDFDLGAGVTNLTSAGLADAFVIKLIQCTPTSLVLGAATLTDLTNECSVAMPTAPTATNNCGEVFTGTPNVSFPITAQGTTVVTWTFDDGNGNTSTQTQNVIINDVTAAVAAVANLADLTSQCSVAMPTAPTAADICKGSITGTSNVSFPITTQGTTVVIWTYNDGNGNTSNQTQSVIINDVTAPVADVASLTGLTSQCSMAMPTAPTATDNCKGSINGTSNVSFPITTQGTTVVTWTYNDGNGNTSNQTQNVIITDATAPVVNIANLVNLVECTTATPTVPTATDNCNGSITGTSNVSFPIIAQGTTVVTWTFDDGNGNTATQTQNVTISDAIAPVADVVNLTDLTNQCSVTAPTTPTATDNCEGSINGTANVSFPITTQGTTVITWTYNDGNGNTSSQTQNVIINDVTAPATDVATLPNLIECTTATPTAPTATDNCEGSITGTSNISFPITTLGTTVVTWTFDDGNGNTSTQNQDVIIDDITAPVPDVANLADLVECTAATPTAPTATDICEGSINGTSNISFPITTQGTTVIIWTFDDGQGNTSMQTQNIIVDENAAPIPDIANLADFIECSTATPPTPTATDVCEASVTGTSNVSFPITTPGTTVITWTYENGNGNTSMQTQNIIIDDAIAPVLDVANLADLIAECSATLPTPPTATDNCVEVINGITNTTFPITTLGTTVITWVFDDGNGNTSTQTQNVIINTVDNSVSISGSSLSANADGYMYQWVDCANNNVSISGATNQNFTPQASGSYTVMINNETCSVTSACIDFTITGILSDINKFGISVYPNPIINQLTIDKGEHKGLAIDIVDETGKLVLSKTATEQKTSIDMSAYVSGIYIVTMKSKGNLITYRIVKN